MKVNDRPIVVVQKDGHLKPDPALELFEEAFQDDRADVAVGSTSSATTLAMMPVAVELKKIRAVDIAGTDSITGTRWSKYVVRTSRTVGQEAVASALLLSDKNTSIAGLVQDYAFGRENAEASRTRRRCARPKTRGCCHHRVVQRRGGALRRTLSGHVHMPIALLGDMSMDFKAAATKAGATVVSEEFLADQCDGLHGVVQRLFNSLKDRSGKTASSATLRSVRFLNG